MQLIVSPIPTPAPFDRFFAELDIKAQTYAHPPTFTVEMSRTWEHLLPGGHTKNLFLKDKKGNQFLVTAIAETIIDLKKLAIHLEAGRFSFGSPERLMTALGVTPGSVTPLAVLNNGQRNVRTILDARLFDHNVINCHPLRNDQTTALSPQDLQKFMTNIHHAPMLIDFNAI